MQSEKWLFGWGLWVHDVCLLNSLQHILHALYNNVYCESNAGCIQGVAINFVKKDDIRILRDIEQYYSTQIDEMPMNVADLIWDRRVHYCGVKRDKIDLCNIVWHEAGLVFPLPENGLPFSVAMRCNCVDWWTFSPLFYVVEKNLPILCLLFLICLKILLLFPRGQWPFSWVSCWFFVLKITAIHKRLIIWTLWAFNFIYFY